MARQTEWWVLGLDRDPVPGDSSVISGLMARMTTLADEANRAKHGVVGLLGDKALNTWMGTSGDAFRAACQPLPGELDVLRTSYDDCAAALKTYQAALARAAQRADDACAAAMRQYNSFPCGAELVPRPSHALSDAEYHAWVQRLEPQQPDWTNPNPPQKPAFIGPPSGVPAFVPAPARVPNPSPGQSPFAVPPAGGTHPAPVWTPRQQAMVNARNEAQAAAVDNITAAQACERDIDAARALANQLKADLPGKNGQPLGTSFDDRFKNAGGDPAQLILDPRAGVDVESASAGPTGLPPDGTKAADVAKWWAGLDDATRGRYIHDHPWDIVDLDGVPDKDRRAAHNVMNPPPVVPVVPVGRKPKHGTHDGDHGPQHGGHGTTGGTPTGGHGTNQPQHPVGDPDHDGDHDKDKDHDGKPGDGHDKDGKDKDGKDGHGDHDGKPGSDPDKDHDGDKDGKDKDGKDKDGKDKDGKDKDGHGGQDGKPGNGDDGGKPGDQPGGDHDKGDHDKGKDGTGGHDGGKPGDDGGAKGGDDKTGGPGDQDHSGTDHGSNPGSNPGTTPGQDQKPDHQPPGHGPNHQPPAWQTTSYQPVSHPVVDQPVFTAPEHVAVHPVTPPQADFTPVDQPHFAGAGAWAPGLDVAAPPVAGLDADAAVPPVAGAWEFDDTPPAHGAWQHAEPVSVAGAWQHAESATIAGAWQHAESATVTGAWAPGLDAGPPAAGAWDAAPAAPATGAWEAAPGPVGAWDVASSPAPVGAWDVPEHDLPTRDVPAHDIASGHHLTSQERAELHAARRSAF